MVLVAYHFLSIAERAEEKARAREVYPAGVSMTLIPLNQQMMVDALGRWTVTAGEDKPKPAKSKRHAKGWQAGIFISKSQIEYSLRLFETEAEADTAAINRIKELLQDEKR